MAAPWREFAGKFVEVKRSFGHCSDICRMTYQTNNGKRFSQRSQYSSGLCKCSLTDGRVDFEWLASVPTDYRSGTRSAVQGLLNFGRICAWIRYVTPILKHCFSPLMPSVERPSLFCWPSFRRSRLPHLIWSMSATDCLNGRWNRCWRMGRFV